MWAYTERTGVSQEYLCKYVEQDILVIPNYSCHHELYELKVDVGMLNTMKIYWADMSSVSLKIYWADVSSISPFWRRANVLIKI